MRGALLGLILAMVFPLAADVPQKLVYVLQPTRSATIQATLLHTGLPAFDGPWHVLGPFDNRERAGFSAVFPPEKEAATDLAKAHNGKNGLVRWREFKDFRLGEVNGLAKLFDETEYCCAFVHHVIECKQATTLDLSLGSDDTLTVYLNGEQLLANDVHRPAGPDQDRVRLRLKEGKNHLLLKICNDDGGWGVYVRPEFPGALEAEFQERLARDFGGTAPARMNPLLRAEAKHYRIETIPIPPEIVLEVGGLAFRPDGNLLCCTRRGEVWLLTVNATGSPPRAEYKLFASGLHEPLGIHLDGKDAYLVQRPELTKLVDRDGDNVADEYVTVCDRWGVSGDYHEFAFGPARDKEGNFYVALNVGFGGGHQSKAPWRGWCVKISPRGELTPWAVGLRSPNGINCSPEGDLFYCDNQGEWVATCKMHHVQPGEYYGHPAGLRWAKDSPYALKLPGERHPSGMLYDGQPGKSGASGMPPVSPPAVWFPYGRMGQSLSEPIWDLTEGKFGPFAGQCFVGDQMRASVMRVFLEKVNGRFQGACFPFKSGFECGVNRLAFAPDGGLYAGMTNRGWGSLGGKPYGLQRLAYTGATPFEVFTMSLTPQGFDLTFTQPVDPASAGRVESYALASHTYHYWSTYGSPEEDQRVEKITGVTVRPDGRGVSLSAANLRPGRVYELRLDGVKSARGEPLLHPEAYYTVNEMRK